MPGHRTYTLTTFFKLLEEKQIRWPASIYHNQQGRMDFQNRLISLVGALILWIHFFW